jgi:CDP-glucose 4,6-dehydratase
MARWRAVEMLVSARSSTWAGRRVLVTGHTGFKGAWLSLWLSRLGADMTGLALAPPTDPSLFERAGLADRIRHVEADIRDFDIVRSVVEETMPDVVFHLAAQSLVRYSYDHPLETYATNVMGTAHVLEACRGSGVRAFVCVTSDKCYENREWDRPYREDDPMGGHDPYSSSKGCAELVAASYRRSFFPPAAMADGGLGLASVRAGNVIGGGDWAKDRLVPDLVRAFEQGVAPEIRSPNAVRPWQHVLEAIGGYLMIADRLLGGDQSVADAWNFGPADDDTRPVSWIVDQMRAAWGGTHDAVPFSGAVPHEAGLLKLDCAKARSQLGWRPALPLSEALGWIVDWHKRVGSGEAAADVTIEQIDSYRARSGITA